MIIWLGRGSLFLGLVSLCGMCFLPLAAASVLAVGSGIGGIAMARDDLALMDRNIMDPAGRGSTRMGHSHAVAGIILAAAGAILSIVIQLPNLMIL